MKTAIAIITLPLLTLTACSAPNENENTPEEAEYVAEAEVGTPDPVLSSPVAAETPEQVSQTAIPNQIRGRWGMVAADCDPQRADNKGLMVVAANSLTFYESRAALEDISEAGDSRIRANFAFTGEGMSWPLEMVLDVQDGGSVLIRRDYGDDALPGPIRYLRCPA